MWPPSAPALVAAQLELAAATPPLWARSSDRPAIAGCVICFPRGKSGPGAGGDPAWAAAATLVAGRITGQAQVSSEAGAPYLPGLLALREGPGLEAAVRALPAAPDVLLVDATGRDHPRGAGLALHLGAALDLPTVGVTHRPLLARGGEPGPEAGASSALTLEGRVVGAWLRTRPGTRPLAVHPAWRTDLEIALEIVALALAGHRTPEPLRQARRLARSARARASERSRGASEQPREGNGQPEDG